MTGAVTAVTSGDGGRRGSVSASPLPSPLTSSLPQDGVTATPEGSPRRVTSPHHRMTPPYPRMTPPYPRMSPHRGHQESPPPAKAGAAVHAAHFDRPPSGPREPHDSQETHEASNGGPERQGGAQDVSRKAAEETLDAFGERGDTMEDRNEAMEDRGGPNEDRSEPMGDRSEPMEARGDSMEERGALSLPMAPMAPMGSTGYPLAMEFWQSHQLAASKLAERLLCGAQVWDMQKNGSKGFRRRERMLLGSSVGCFRDVC